MRILSRPGACAAVLALAVGAASAQVTTEPLPPPPPAGVDANARQTGVVTFESAGRAPVIVRSFEPDAAQAGRYRISFEALDVDDDGAISRGEATAHPTLAGEFAAVDANNDGRLERSELGGWIAR